MAYHDVYYLPVPAGGVAGRWLAPMAGPSSAAEWVRLNGQLVAVPSVVCERRPAFDAALSQTAWDTLSEEQRSQLRVRGSGRGGGA